MQSLRSNISENINNASKGNGIKFINSITFFVPLLY